MTATVKFKRFSKLKMESDSSNDDKEQKKSEYNKEDESGTGTAKPESNEVETIKEKEYSCNQCSKICNTAGRLRRHGVVHQNKPYECFVCKQIIISRFLHKRHVNSCKEKLKRKEAKHNRDKTPKR